MDKIPYETILDIRKKANIVDIIAKYIPLEKRGKNYFAICPFHDDHNPSMSVSEEKQIYTCFVCGASGNVFNFVMKYENVSFVSAVKKVASFVGINLDVQDVKEKKEDNTKYDKYYKMFDVVNKYYKNNIKSVYGKNAIKYLHERKINDDIINEFEIGLSLNDNSVSKLLQEKGYDKDELIDIGICGNTNNYMYDTFRNRIMFPLCNLDGQVVGFSGRIYNGEKESKYVNSKESVIFKKGHLLYNYHRAINEAREKRQIIVVEGFMDVIRLFSVGIKNVVASMGTAITKEHASLIKKLSQNVVLSFDGDKAGEKATISAIKEFEKIGITPKIIRLEDDLDPDDYIIKKGKDAYLNHLKNTLSVIDFNLKISEDKTNFNDFNEVSSFVKDAVTELEKINDKVIYELTLNKIAKQTGLSKETIDEMVEKKPASNAYIIDKRKPQKKNKYQKAEEYLLHYMLRSKDAILLYQDKVSYLPNKKLSIIAMEILEFYEKKGYINVSDFTLFLEDKTDLISEVLRIDDLDLPDNVSRDVLIDYIKTIDEEILNNEINKVKDKIKTETNVQNKIELLEKLRVLKKRECK
ncbi:MAG TPA: DNA primase [Candidatus Aphodocola excrementigallinarum]|uniref:DNA primase n=1 Tax=Candidatus Aphodocola excrementigallinarum TaxID=2840670 RepID=A0A9D1LJC1_9FIRM|nr:DNA primase [Candidatus Aphodocola excrementigallinarum]